MLRNLRTNLVLFPLFNFVSDFIVIAPALVPWYLSHGLTATSVFAIQAVFAVAIVLFEVPSGFVADALGRRTALLAGALVWPVGVLLYRFGGSFWAFAGAELVIAIAVSLFSGCLSALLYDTLAGLPAPSGTPLGEEYQRREGIMASTARVGTLVAVLLGGVLAERRLGLSFEFNAVTMLALVPIAALMVEPRRERPRLRDARDEILGVARRCFRDPAIRPFVVGVAVLGMAGRVVIWASLLVCGAMALPVAVNGVVFAVLQLSGALGGRFSAGLARGVGRRGFSWLLCLMGPLLLVPLGGPGWGALAACLGAVFLWNLGQPFFYAGINERTDARLRATVLSVANMGSSFLFAILAPLFGQLVDRASLGVAFAALAVLTGAGLAIVALTLPAASPADRASAGS